MSSNDPHSDPQSPPESRGGSQAAEAEAEAPATSGSAGGTASKDSPSGEGGGAAPWAHDLLNRLAFASLVEQRRSRRWNLAFRFAFLAYLLLVLLIYFPSDWLDTKTGEKHAAVVGVRGVIADGSDASAERIIQGLRAAFRHADTAGVILKINSPGGSPVQSSYINSEVARLREKHPDIPLYAVITDIGASGGYYIAVSADKIYANEASLVGSIGVLMNGFGFVEAMDKLGVERRLLTAGESKGFLDPFSPTQANELRHTQGLLEHIHQQFITAVREGRGERLSTDEQLFTGLVWTGQQSVELGLVDALGSARYVAREVIGVDTMMDFTPRKSYVDMLAERIGAAFARTLAVELGVGRPGLR